MLAQHVLRQYFLYFVDVNRLIKLFAYAWLYFAGDPDLQFCIQVKGTCGFDTESGNAFVGYAEVFYFTAGDALFVNQDHTFVRENKRVPYQLEAKLNVF